jgi:uncharacterized protein YdeI (YjbR/CyaY-like superfamily)
VLVIFLPRAKMIRVGALGAFRFPRGYYVYIGSALNELSARVAHMIERGRMTPIGLAKVEDAKRNGRSAWDKTTIREGTRDIPADLRQALQANRKAQQDFGALAPSHKGQYVHWITDAKRDDTGQRRIRAAVRMLKENWKLGIDVRVMEKRKT